MPRVSVFREIDPSAQISPEAKIGPYCVVGPHVTIGPHTTLTGHVAVSGHTVIGSGNVFGEGCVLGAAPQDLKYAGGPTMLIIGHRNRFSREVTAHIGTEVGGCLTRIGDDNILMDGCHVAHDCYVDDHAYLGRHVQLAGHIHVQSGAVMEDLVGAHHFTTVGRYARVLARTPVRRDVPPYTCFGSKAHQASPPSVQGIHEEGIQAAQLSPEAEHDLRQAMRELFDDESALQTKIEQMANVGIEGEVAALCQFIQCSLQGLYGRHRELYRGKVPPEAQRYLPPDRQALLRRPMT